MPELLRQSTARPPLVSYDVGVVLAAMQDGRMAWPHARTLKTVAGSTVWPGARTFGVARTRRALRELITAGYVRRRRPKGSPFVYYLTELGADLEDWRRAEGARMTELPRQSDAGHPATPGCGCERCTAVFDEWGRQAREFQQWFDALPDERLRTFFGLERQGGTAP